MTVIFNILKLKERRSNLRSKQTHQETLIWSCIKNQQLGFKFRRQHSIGGYVVDFYCPKKKLIIEIDGSQHFKKNAREYDENRTNFFQGLNLKVIRFTNTEINKNIKGVILKILSELK